MLSPRSVCGPCPPDYEPNLYLGKVSDFLHGDRRVLPAEHHAYACWLESSPRQAYRSRRRQQAFVVALRGMGYLTREQREHCDRLGMDTSQLQFRRPPSGWNPEMLPLVLWHLLVEIGRREQWTQLQALDSARALAWLWHSRRIQHAAGEPYGKLALSYLATYLGLKPNSRKEASAALSRLERYRLIRCTIHHREKPPQRDKEDHPKDERWQQRRPNHYQVNRLLLQRAGTMILLPPAHHRGTTEPSHPALQATRYTCEGFSPPERDLPDELIRLLEPIDEFDDGDWFATSRRRHASASPRQDTPPLPWRPHNRGPRLLRCEETILEREAQTVPLHEDLLRAVDRRRSAYDQILAAWLLEHGLTFNQGRTRSGRLHHGGLASPLFCSRRPGRRGHLFWQAVAQPLWVVDMRAADWLLMAGLSRDGAMVSAWADGDIYATTAPLLGLRPGHPECRSLAKCLSLATLYGAGRARLMECARERGVSLVEEDVRRFRRGLREQYPDWHDWRTAVSKIGISCANYGRRVVLPHGEYLGLELGRGYAAPAHVTQSAVRLVMAQFVQRLDTLGDGYLPTFEIHDAVVVRREPPPERVDDLLRTIVAETLGQVLPPDPACKQWVRTFEKLLAKASFAKIEPIRVQEEAIQARPMETTPSVVASPTPGHSVGRVA